jgi:transcriptional regulator with GAF, ATPase, and Fis domain
MDEQRSSHIEVLRRQQESLRADIEAIGREGAPHPQLIPLVQHACELLDAMVSEQSALSRAHARLHETAAHRAARIAIIHRIGQLITSNLSLDQILQSAVEAIHEYQEYPIVGVLLVDPEDPATLVLRACTNVYHPAEIGRYRQSIQQGIVGTAACTRRRIILEDVPSPHHHLTPPGPSNIRTEIAVPIIVSDRLLGVLHVGVEQCSEDEAAGLQIIADQLGVAIDKAYLFARTQQTLAETQLLYETNQRMSTAMNIDEVIKAYLEQVAARGRYVCTVMLYAFDEGGQRIALYLYWYWVTWKNSQHPVCGRDRPI